MRARIVATLAALVLGAFLLPKPALAMPTFAQAYHVDCSACHTMVPALNAYGRYIQSTQFGALNPDVLKKAAPFVMRESISVRSTGKLDRLEPNLKATWANFSVNAVGELNKYISFRLEQSLYSNNIGGGNTSHFWLSYNQLFKGDGHLIVGKFDAPSAPAFSYWSDMTGFSGPSITVGQHSYALSGDRWGIGFNYVPINYQKVPYKVQMAYQGNSPSMFNDAAFNSLNPYQPGSAGSDKAFIYRVAWARPDNPVEVGLYGSLGTYVLAPGYVNPIDKYTASGFYAQRDPQKLIPGVMFYYQQTNDSNIGPGKASQKLTQSASSWAYGVELNESLFNGNVMLGIRPVEYIGGLQANSKGYDYLSTAKPHFGSFDIAIRAPKILSPYVWITAEDAVAASSNAPYGQPTWRLGLKWATPLRGLIP